MAKSQDCSFLPPPRILTFRGVVLISFLFALLCLSSFVVADDIYLKSSITGSGNDWTKSNYWSGAAPSTSTSNNYFVGEKPEGYTGSAINLRTKEQNSEDKFPDGNTLWMGYNMDHSFSEIQGELALKATTFTVNDLRLGNALINQAKAAGTITINGNIQIDGTARFNFSATTDRKINVASKISGTGEITLNEGYNTSYQLIISHSNNPFTGTLNVSKNSNIELSGVNAMEKASSVVLNSGSAIKLSAVQTLNNISGSGTIVTNGYSLTLNSTTPTTFSGVISGTGSVTKNDEGTQTLSGANTYSGGTTIFEGTLKLTGGGTLGTGNVTNSGTLEFNNSTATITPNISGAGDILVSAGTATLSGAVTQTGGATTLADGTTLSIGSASTLYNLSSGSESNPATLTVTGNLTLGNDEKSTFIGSITAHKITVNTANDVALKLYTGANNKVTADSLTVSSGELDFKGYFTGNIEVFNGSIFSPGNSIGEANITGNITFTSEDPAISNGVAWFEFGEYADGADVNHDLFVMESGGTFTADDGVILLDFANNDAESWAAEGNTYKLVSNGGFTNEQDYTSWLATTPDYSSLFKLTGGADGLYLVGIKAAPEPGSGVPEPSTWALLLLGAAGLLYVRKRTRK